MALNILDYTRMAIRACINMKQKIIVKCFRKTGFMKEVENKIEWDKEQKLRAEPENEIECEFLKSPNLSKNITFRDFTELVVDIAVFWLWTEDEIISQSIYSWPFDDEEEMDFLKPLSRITVDQAKDAVHIVQCFMECSENLESDSF